MVVVKLMVHVTADHLKKKMKTYVGQVMQKHVLCRMQTTKAQISLRIRAVWSAPLLFAAEIVYVYLLNSKFQDFS